MLVQELHYLKASSSNQRCICTISKPSTHKLQVPPPPPKQEMVFHFILLDCTVKQRVYFPTVHPFATWYCNQGRGYYKNIRWFAERGCNGRVEYDGPATSDCCANMATGEAQLKIFHKNVYM